MTPIDLLDAASPQTFNLYIKKTETEKPHGIILKCNKVKLNKMRYVCVLDNPSIFFPGAFNSVALVCTADYPGLCTAAILDFSASYSKFPLLLHV